MTTLTCKTTSWMQL